MPSRELFVVVRVGVSECTDGHSLKPDPDTVTGNVLYRCVPCEAGTYNLQVRYYHSNIGLPIEAIILTVMQLLLPHSQELSVLPILLLLLLRPSALSLAHFRSTHVCPPG
jgi:hypothetical protein